MSLEDLNVRFHASLDQTRPARNRMIKPLVASVNLAFLVRSPRNAGLEGGYTGIVVPRNWVRDPPPRRATVEQPAGHYG